MTKSLDLLTDAILERDQPRTTDLFFRMVKRDGQSVNARSIMGLMMLAASTGADVEVSAEGEDCGEALTAIIALIEAKFGEE